MLEAGTIITCPKCKTETARLLFDIHKGEPIIAELFEGIESALDEGATDCPACGESFERDGRVHTKRGWRP